MAGAVALQRFKGMVAARPSPRFLSVTATSVAELIGSEQSTLSLPSSGKAAGRRPEDPFRELPMLENADEAEEWVAGSSPATTRGEIR